MVLERLQEIIAKVLHVDVREVTENSSFDKELGADSLDVFQILSMAEQEFQIKVTGEDFRAVKTVGDAVEMIRRLMD